MVPSQESHVVTGLPAIHVIPTSSQVVVGSKELTMAIHDQTPVGHTMAEGTYRTGSILYVASRLILSGTHTY